MIKEAIEKILSLSPVQELQFDEREYTARPIHAVTPAHIDGFELNTLTGIIDYLASDVDGISGSKPILHVMNYDKVILKSACDAVWKERDYFAIATTKSHATGFTFDTFIPLEKFIIELQSKFIHTDTLKEMLTILGNVRAEKVETHADDGVTQMIDTRDGMNCVQKTDLPNPVLLAPYRTFHEIDQPVSPFILRLKQGREAGDFQAALFEADGGAWKMEAIQSIKEYFKAQLPEGSVVTILA